MEGGPSFISPLLIWLSFHKVRYLDNMAIRHKEYSFLYLVDSLQLQPLARPRATEARRWGVGGICEENGTTGTDGAPPPSAASSGLHFCAGPPLPSSPSPSPTP